MLRLTRERIDFTFPLKPDGVGKSCSSIPYVQPSILSSSAERRTHATTSAENILRLHHDESIEDALHGRHRQSDSESATTKTGFGSGFTTKYRVHRLVYFERFKDIRNAIEREKQIKSWLRCKKVDLIVSVNPEWRDLSQEWYGRHQFPPDTEIA